MRGISDTISRITASAAAQTASLGQIESSTLQPLLDFGSNPGALDAFIHIPNGMKAGAPLVVVLHGCSQTAAGYDQASGWSQLAEHGRFAVLYPAQRRLNTANGCFNWFQPNDVKRGRGEALSIRQMIAAVQGAHRIDPSQIFITGLSAGGAMCASMLAVYPEVFAGGAIIAGLPHGVASGVAQALDRMRGHGLPPADRLTTAVRNASKHPGPWPKLSIWHGDADHTVDVSNATASLSQWLGVHGIDEGRFVANEIDGAHHRSWAGADGQIQVETYLIPGLGHGAPLRTTGPGALGIPAPFMLEAGISSTERIAQFWGISGDPIKVADRPDATLPTIRSAQGASSDRRGRQPEHGGLQEVGKVIEDALRAAGLMG